MPLLLPIFHAQLKACPIPNGRLVVIMLAVFSIGGIIQICRTLGSIISFRERLVHDAVVSKWEMLFPWMQFFSNNFLVPSQTPPSTRLVFLSILRGSLDYRASTFSLVDLQMSAKS